MKKVCKISIFSVPDQSSYETGSELLGGVTGLLKVQSGIVGKYVADECVKLMGGSVSVSQKSYHGSG